MPARNGINRLSSNKCLCNQSPLLIFAPVPPGLAKNNLHAASACDQSNGPVARLGAAQMLTQKMPHARRPSAQGYEAVSRIAHHLACLADIAELFCKLDQTNLGADNLLLF